MADLMDINTLPLHQLPSSRQNSIKNSIASSSSVPIPPGRKYTQEEADTIPWKYIGYRVVLRWLTSSQNFLIMRKFGAANTRVTLSLQDQVANLEEQLAEIDDYCARRGTERLTTGRFGMTQGTIVGRSLRSYKTS